MKNTEINRIYLGSKEVSPQSIIYKDNIVNIAKSYRSIFRKQGQYEVGDAVLWDIEREMFKVIDPAYLKEISLSRYEPIGVVAIPSSHNVYGTGECGVVALKSGSLSTPDSGQLSNIEIYWGQYDVDIPDLVNRKSVLTLDSDNLNKVSGIASTGLLPVLYSEPTKFICPHDPTASYFEDPSTSDVISSPYNKDGSRNLNYYKNSLLSDTVNALSDFDGRNNTSVLLIKATKQSDWRTSSSIINLSAEGYSPAACCCWRYHTVGTNQGDWYLPACGELGYVCPRYNLINSTISALRIWVDEKKYSLIGVGDGYWTSTEYNYSSARRVFFLNGNVYAWAKNDSACVRPFIRIR